MAPTTMTATGTWLDPLGAPRKGRIEFSPVDARSVNTGSLVDRSTVAAALDANGSISVALVRLTNGYNVREVLQGCPIVHYVLPDGAGPVDLSSLTV